MPVANVKSYWTGGNLRFVSVQENMDTTPMVHFGESNRPLYVKIHNRPATTGNTLEVRARPSAVDAEHFAIDSTLDMRPDPDDTKTATGGGVRALQGVCRLDTGYSMTGGGLIGVYGQVANNGTINGSGIMAAAIYGLIEDGGTYTALSHLASLWLDSHLTKTITAGSKQLIYATNNGSTTLDEVLYVYGGNKITRLMKLDTVSGMVGDAVTSDYTFTNTKLIKIDIDGETYYLVADKPA